MQFSIYINQMRSLEWGLNLSQSALFAFLYEAQSWAEQIIIDGDTYYWVAKEKVIEELPILTDKPNTIRKLLVDIERLELISRAVRNNKPVFRVTEKGKLWNRTEGGKKIPTKAKSKAGKNPPLRAIRVRKILTSRKGRGREKSRPGREIIPIKVRKIIRPIIIPVINLPLIRVRNLRLRRGLLAPKKHRFRICVKTMILLTGRTPEYRTM